MIDPVEILITDIIPFPKLKREKPSLFSWIKHLMTIGDWIGHSVVLTTSKMEKTDKIVRTKVGIVKIIPKAINNEG